MSVPLMTACCAVCCLQGPMNKLMPSIHESANDLKQRLRRERHPAKQQQFHALYLLAHGQARRRTDLAACLGVDRNTVGHWLDQ